MANNLPKIVWYSTHHVALMKSWLLQKQTTLGKDKANPLIVDSLFKTIWSSIHHLLINEVLTIPGQTTTGVNTPRSDEDRLELMELTVFLLPSDEKVRVEVNTTVAVKKVNDITRLQAPVDKKRVIVTEATIRDALCLDDVEGVECLPNEEIFVELARMDYEKPSTKLTFYKAFFSSQQQVGDLSTHTTKYTSRALTQKVFANMRRVGKGFFGVETPRFEGMLVAQEVKEGDADENVEDVNDVQPTPPQSPQAQKPTPQPQPSQDAGLPTDLLQNLLDTCTALTKRVKHLELDKIAQALEITKLKRRVKKLEKRNKLKGRMITDMDANDDVVLEEAKDVTANAKDEQDADVQVNADLQGRTAESQAEIYKIDMDHANKVLSIQGEESKPFELQEVVDVVTTTKIITEVVTTASVTIITADVPIPTATTAAAPTLTVAPSRRTNGVVIRDPKESTTTTSTIITLKLNLRIKAKGFWYQALKKKPQTEAQARKNMMIYLKDVVGFKMDYFKGMSYDDIRPIFEAKFDSNMAFLQNKKEQIDEEDSRALKRINETPSEKAAKRQKLDEEVEELKRHLQIVPNKEDDVYTKATPLARKVPVVDYKIINQNNKPYYKIKRADGSHQLYLSFLSLSRNFDREDLEAYWSLVKERFATTNPKNFFDDCLLITLGAMFEKPDIHAQIWKNQRSVHGPAKVKSWKLLESCGVQIITFTTTQLIFLVERRYPLIRFTLDQMLNDVRLKVEEESEVSLEFSRFIRQQHQEGAQLE
uniref:Uncharacterized protein n=1 Tax=Tanacetum cinerariifolium TaxID=118510 RepID=A0A6L2MMF8_TANCI|nr:hypothetical protein [Tanacetum cinerariifolium]